MQQQPRTLRALKQKTQKPKAPKPLFRVEPNSGRGVLVLKDGTRVIIKSNFKFWSNAGKQLHLRAHIKRQQTRALTSRELALVKKHFPNWRKEGFSKPSFARMRYFRPEPIKKR